MKIVSVRVFPNAKKQKVINESNVLKVYVRAPASDGKANKVVIDILADYFSVKKSSVRIIRGEKSRIKIVSVL